MCAAFAQAALVHDENRVGPLDGGEAMGDQDRGSTGDHAGESEADALFGLGVDRACGFVEDEDAGVVGQGAGEADELLLAGRQGSSAFDDGFLKLFWKRADEVAYGDLVGGTLEAVVGDPLGAEANVVGYGAREEEGVLQDDAEALAKGLQVLLADVDAVDEDLTVLDVVRNASSGR